MRIPSTPDIAREMAQLCAGRPIDVVLTAVAEVLARTLAEHDCDPEDALPIVAAFTRNWLETGGVRPAIIVRSGEPDSHETGLEDL